MAANLSENLAARCEQYGNLEEQVSLTIWPTPTAMNDNHYINNSPNKDNRNSRGLDSEVDHQQKYPTPTSRDYKGGYKTESLTRKDGKSRATDALPNAVIDGKGTETVIGQLNPDWVEWLMGWPIGWTSMESITELDWRDWTVDPADGEPSKQSPTPSSNPRGAYIGREMDFETLSTVSNTTGTRYGMTIETYAHHKPGGGEVPRVATGIKNRVGRLKAIGNGQVPQVAAMAWRILNK